MQKTLLLLLPLVGCVGDSSSTKDGGADASVEAAPPGAPTHAASSLGFTDADPTKGTVSGVVNIGKASDESDVTSYVLYWGTDTSTRLGTAITTIAKTGSDLKYSLSGTVPVGANDLLVFTANAQGEMATATALASPDNYAHFVDISGGQAGYGSNFVPSAVIDTINDKLLVAANTASGVGLYRCNLDGTSCTFTDISSGQPSYLSPSAAVDTVNAKLLVATTNLNYLPGLIRCNLDGTGCAFVDISAGQPGGMGARPRALIDSANSKLLVVTENDAASAYKPGLFRCNLDGTGCAWVDIGASQAANTGHYPSPAIDTTNNRLLVAATTEVSSVYRADLTSCALDGTSCSMVDISASQPQFSGVAPSLVIDKAGGKLLAVAEDDPLNGPGLFRCNLDGTGCTFADVSGGHRGPPSSSGMGNSAAIDVAHNALVAASQDNTTGTKPALFHCNLDGTGCLYVDVSAGQGQNCGFSPSLVIDAKNNRALVVTDDGANNHKPALFWLGLW